MREEPKNPCYKCAYYYPKSFGRGWCHHEDAPPFRVVAECDTCEKHIISAHWADIVAPKRNDKRDETNNGG
jgi:hypothetical protein